MFKLQNTGLPAQDIAEELNRTLADTSAVVVTAPPGAGKSTVLPLTILEGTAEGKILMLEPRRLAARQIAERMASLLGERCGQTVGYRIRFESKVSSATRIEVLTEGILTRIMMDDPTLDGVSTVIFDEFHERSIASDEAIALCLEARKLVRPDLRIIIMSATIDAEAICKALEAPLVQCQGRCFPVELIHAQDIPSAMEAASTVARTILKAHNEQDGDILAFLPGEADIRKCEELLQGQLGSTAICPLYGNLPFEQQRRAIAPSAPGDRKVVLATPIAETSLTIEGVRVVVDSGLCRKLVFNSQNGLSRLETVSISMDMANQRSGRAGRVAPGVCYRLWSKGSELLMKENRVPEILEADLTPLVLDLAVWGENNPEQLSWLTPPPAYTIRSAQQLLESMGAIADGGVTRHGRELSKLPCHPRIAQMLLSAKTPEMKALAADIAAILEERDPLPQEQSADLSIRVNALRRDRKRYSRLEKISSQYRDMCGRVNADNSSADPYAVGALLASAFPERVAKAQPNGLGKYLLASGDPAFADKDDALSSCEWLAVCSANTGPGASGRIFLAAPVDIADLASLTRERDNISWDSRKGAVTAQHERLIGKLMLGSKPIAADREQAAAIICQAAAKEGLSMLDFNDDVANLQRRIAAVAGWHPELELPDVSTEKLLETAVQWLPTWLNGATSAAEMKKIDLCQAIWAILSYEQQLKVDALAPSHITVPTGSRIRIEYRQGADAPVLRVRLQECFGLMDTPCVDGGRIPVLMELLSPGFKPVQLTKDLRSFWSGTYFEVRKELKRRYPKHSWPEDPLTAEAVRGVRKPGA